MSKYLKQGSTVEYVEDHAEIQSLKFENVRHSVLGFMLGDFDEEGNYVVSEEITKELIEMPKFIAESIDNFEICKSQLKLDKSITFLVTYQGERVTLSLMENVNFEANCKTDTGSWSNINEYVLDEVIVAGEVDRNAIYSRWNISEFAGNQIDVMDCEPELLEKYLGIVNRFKLRIMQNLELLEHEEELEEVESEYFLNIFALLEDYPELKKKVVKELKRNLEEKKEFVQVDKPNFAKALNEILNKAIENNIKELKEEKQQEFKKVQHNAQVRLNIQRQEIIQTVTEKEQTKTVADKKERAVQIVTFETAPVHKKKTLPELVQTLAETKKVVEEKKSNKAVETLVSVVEEVKNETPKKKTKKTAKHEEVVNVIVSQVKHNLKENVTPKTKKKITEVVQEKKNNKVNTNPAQVVPVVAGSGQNNGKKNSPVSANPKKNDGKNSTPRVAARQDKNAKNDKNTKKAPVTTPDKTKKDTQEVQETNPSQAKSNLVVTARRNKKRAVATGQYSVAAGQSGPKGEDLGQKRPGGRRLLARTANVSVDSAITPEKMVSANGKTQVRVSQSTVTTVEVHAEQTL